MQTLDPRRTVAVILGSGAFPHHPGLASPPSFRNSARDIQAYLTAQLRVAADRVLDLFDSEQSPMHLLFEIESFLDKHAASPAADSASDLIFYYVGHGGFVGANRDYYLAIRSTRRGSEGISSIKLTDLASTLNEHAASIRRYLVLDCCFAASAYKELQSGPLAAVVAQTEDALPPRGTALLAAAGRRSPAEAPEGESYTMFSGALLKVLRTGDAGGDAWWTLTEVGDRVRRYLNERYAGNAIRPEVLSPAQSHGDLARDVRLFPNPAVAPAAADQPVHAGERHVVATSAAAPLVKPAPPAATSQALPAADLVHSAHRRREPPGATSFPARDERALAATEPVVATANKPVDLAGVDDSALLQDHVEPSDADVVHLPDLPDSFRAPRSTHDLLAAWKTEAKAAIKQTQAHPHRGVMRRLLMTLILYILGIVVLELPIVAAAFLAPVALLSGRVNAWLGLGVALACVTLTVAVTGFATKVLLGARLIALVEAYGSYRRELAAMSAQRLFAYARVMITSLQSWHLGRRPEVVQALCDEVNRSVRDAKERYASATAARLKLEKASSTQRESRVLASALASQEQRMQVMKSLLLRAMEHAKEARAAADLLRTLQMKGPDSQVYAVSLFRAASAAFLRLAEA